jgi:hypothetical protein
LLSCEPQRYAEAIIVSGKHDYRAGAGRHTLSGPDKQSGSKRSEYYKKKQRNH